ncbi:MAG: SDR family NAD(P)-dependent oxidoreductase [Hyphomicrobium sp.]|nr:SDR family NAD(P)-dependent oxidoreductase [Hyphomicrobium sp.]
MKGAPVRLSDATFIVTGATSGLGAAVTDRLIAEGAFVVGADINIASAAEVEARHPGKVKFIKTDVTSEEDARATIALAKSEFRGLRGLVNCAGIAPGEKLVGRKGAHALESFIRTVSINLVGTFNMMRLAAEAMQEEEPDETGDRGIIVNTASIAAYDGQIGQAAYAASKGGVVSLTLPAARELAKSKIRVMTIAPGVFETPMMAGMGQQVQDALGATVPHPARLGRPSEFAILVCAIARNQYLNGEVIRLDGALRMAAS